MRRHVQQNALIIVAAIVVSFVVPLRAYMTGRTAAGSMIFPHSSAVNDMCPAKRTVYGGRPAWARAWGLGEIVRDSDMQRGIVCQAKKKSALSEEENEDKMDRMARKQIGEDKYAKLMDAAEQVQ